MRFKGRLELEHGLKQINIVPLINIIFLLIIFFMLSFTFLTQAGMKVDLPKAVTSQIIAADNIEIIITDQNALYLDGKSTDMPALKMFFRQAKGKNQTVLIKADQHASLGKAAQIWDMAREAGIKEVSIATNQE